MPISYTRLRKHPVVFLRLFGMKPSTFDELCEKLAPIWQEKITDRYKRPGRYYKLSLPDMLMILLLYYRTYTTPMMIGMMFGMEDSRVCRIIRQLEPLVAQLVAIDKNRTLTQEDVALLVDATEQPIERPATKQRVYYSGKKKRHTLKTEIRVTPEGKIRVVSKSYPGKTHDFSIHKASDPLPSNTPAYLDAAYQGVRARCKKAKTPFKKSKRRPLSKRKIAYNRALAKRRVKIEHTLAQIKNFRILSDRYRNKRKRYNLKFNVIAGIVNLKNGFLNKQFANEQAA